MSKIDFTKAVPMSSITGCRPPAMEVLGFIEQDGAEFIIIRDPKNKDGQVAYYVDLKLPDHNLAQTGWFNIVFKQPNAGDEKRVVLQVYMICSRDAGPKKRMR